MTTQRAAIRQATIDALRLAITDVEVTADIRDDLPVSKLPSIQVLAFGEDVTDWVMRVGVAGYRCRVDVRCHIEAPFETLQATLDALVERAETAIPPELGPYTMRLVQIVPEYDPTKERPVAVGVLRYSVQYAR